MSTQVEAATSASFPIGHFSRPDAPTREEIRRAIASIAALPENLRSAAAGLDELQLDTPYRDGGWTVRQLIHHVADSHVNLYVRFKLAMTENWPTIRPYDQDSWVTLPDSRLPAGVSLDLLQALHRRWVTIMEAMTDQDWQRGFLHPETGNHTLAQAAMLYAWHGQHHTAHITELRKRKGW